MIQRLAIVTSPARPIYVGELRVGVYKWGLYLLLEMLRCSFLLGIHTGLKESPEPQWSLGCWGTWSRMSVLGHHDRGSRMFKTERTRERTICCINIQFILGNDRHNIIQYLRALPFGPTDSASQSPDRLT